MEEKSLKIRNLLINNKKEHGITVIALVITIIVLLILAGVTIATLTAENGILTNAEKAKEKTGQANAEEQVEIAVIGSIGKDGNIDNGALKNNLEKIDKISGIPDTIEDTNFPLTVAVDGYNVTITKDGNIKKAGKWAETTNAEGEKVITNGITELKIGDYVIYDPTNGGEITDDKTENGKAYSYKSPQGTYHANEDEESADTRENMDKGNGYADQYFSVSAHTGGWRVLGIDEDTNEILLVSADVVETVDNENFFLSGQTGYEWGIKELNDICEIYGKGKGASGARSIDVDDINKITGYNPEKTGNGKPFAEGKMYEYGNEVTYTKHDSIRLRIFENKKWKTLQDGESTTLISTGYWYYPETLTEHSFDLQIGLSKSSKEYKMLFSRDKLDYWLGSSYMMNMDSSSFGISYVRYGRIDNGDHALCYSFGFADGVKSISNHGVRPVVSLKSDANIVLEKR